MASRRIALPRAATAASVARAGVAEAVPAAWPAAVRDNAVLIVSELVTNALLHAGTEVELLIDVSAERIRIAVTDSDPALPRMTRGGDDEEEGLGLQIVDNLADRWGVQPLAVGKQVWFELRAATTEPPPPPA